jgi:hypothetical protein
MDEDTRIAVHRLLVLALGHGTGAQAAANFLMAWWDAPALGGFDLAQIYDLDPEAAMDACRVFTFLAGRPDDAIGVFDPAEMQEVIGRWRPGLSAVRRARSD